MMMLRPGKPVDAVNCKKARTEAEVSVRATRGMTFENY